MKWDWSSTVINGVDSVIELVLLRLVLSQPEPTCSADLDVSLAVRGDRPAFGRLVEQHGPAVFKLCARLLGSTDEARDVAQEAFVRAWQQRATFEIGQSFAPWILRIARNAALDRLRSRKPSVGVEILDTLADPARAADDALHAKRTEARLQQAVAALPVQYRELIELTYVQGRKISEVATIVGAPNGTVMTWLYRARQQLRQQLGVDA